MIIIIVMDPAKDLVTDHRHCSGVRKELDLSLQPCAVPHHLRQSLSLRLQLLGDCVLHGKHQKIPVSEEKI